MTHTMSIRLGERAREQLRHQAEINGETPAGLAQRLVEEGLRMEAHPQVRFRPTPEGGRVAALVAGPDVVEVIEVLSGLEATGDDAVEEAATWLDLPPRAVRAALDYYGDHAEEIDRERDRRAAIASEVRARWDRQQQLLS